MDISQKLASIFTRVVGIGILIFLAMMATAGGYFRKFGYDYTKTNIDAERMMWLIVGFAASVVLLAVVTLIAKSKVELPKYSLTWVNWLYTRPVILGMLLVVVWSGVVFFMFPGGWNYDFTNQINELLTNNHGQIHSDTYPIAHFLFGSKSTELTNQHGAILTLIYDAVIFISVKFFTDATQGIFFLSLLQLLLGTFAIVFALRHFTRNVSDVAKMLILLLIGLNPYFPIYLIQLTKTPLFAVNFIIFFTLFMKLLENRAHTNKEYVGLFLSMLGMLIGVKFAFMLLLPTVIVFSFLMKKRWKKFIVVTGVALVVFKVIMMTMNGSGYIKMDDPIEAKTIQIQQVALYVKSYPNDIDSADKKALEKIFSLKGLARYYDPRTTDMIKSTGLFNYVYRYRTVTEKDWEKFNGVWLNMFKRHPRVFVHAFFAKTFGYFDVLDQPRRDLANTGQIAFAVDKPHQYEYSVPESSKIKQNTLKSMLDIYDDWPVLELFSRPNFWIVVGLLLIAMQLIYSGESKYILLFVPFFLLVGVMVVSPVNNLDRYGIPYFLFIPILIPWLSNRSNTFNC